MQRTKHIFLTGEIQVGKSTLIDRVLHRHPGWRTGGFKTVTASSSGGEGHRAVYLLPAGQPDAPRGPGNLVGIRLGKGQRTANSAVFDQEGVKLLSCSQQADLVIMDELGTMENEALMFQQQVLSVLEGERPVLGVLKKKETPFLRSIRDRKDVRIIELNLQSFDECLKLVDNFLYSAVENKLDPEQST